MQVCFDLCRGKQLLLWQGKKKAICVSGFQAIMLRFMPVQKLLHGFISRVFHQKSGQSHDNLGRTIMQMKKWHWIKLSTEWVTQGTPVLAQREHRAGKVLFLLILLLQVLSFLLDLWYPRDSHKNWNNCCLTCHPRTSLTFVVGLGVHLKIHTDISIKLAYHKACSPTPHYSIHKIRYKRICLPLTFSLFRW